jgi:hypothetical protein
MRSFVHVLAVCASLVALGLSSPARAEAGHWYDAALRGVQKGSPFVVHVTVPLCSNAQIDCGSSVAGRPRDLAHNVYWGAVFGARRFFERKSAGWERVVVEPGAGDVLERVVFRKWIPKERWGTSKDVEALVVLEAFAGDRIDQAVDRFHGLATRGGSVKVTEAGVARSLEVHVAGYAGHNRLLDGKKLPALGAEKRSPLPTFVLACYSEGWFAPSLRAAGSTPLFTTKALMAPEGYLIEALVSSLAARRTAREAGDSAIEAYASWQKLKRGVASAMFVRAP